MKIPIKILISKYRGPEDIYDRMDSSREGTFGFIPRYWCDECNIGFAREPEQECTYKGCGFESFYGPEEAEYEYECPNCGRANGSVFECDGKSRPFKMLKRFTAPAVPSPHEVSHG